MLKVGILGMGMMGWFHAKRYWQIPGVEVVAIADVLAERLEANESVVGNLADTGQAIDLSALARFGDGSALIAEAGVDIVDICLPTFLHARYTIEALEAGCHVLCEKPMALSVSDADRMIAAAERTGRQLMIAQCIRFWPEYRYLKQCVREETFGRLLSLNMYRIGGRPIWSWENWFLDPSRSGGPMYDLHVHDVDFVNDMLGIPDRVQAAARRSQATGAHDVVHAIYDYRDGPQVHIHAGWSHAQIPFQAGFDAWFEKGYLRYDGRQDPPLHVFDDLHTAKGRPAEYEPGDGYHNEIVYFVDCVTTGRPPSDCLPRSVRDSLRLIGLEIEAAESGKE